MVLIDRECGEDEQQWGKHPNPAAREFGKGERGWFLKQVGSF
jgi:hypothetical protein